MKNTYKQSRLSATYLEGFNYDFNKRTILRNTFELPQINTSYAAPSILKRNITRFKGTDTQRFYNDNSLQKNLKDREKIQKIINEEKELIKKLEKAHQKRILMEGAHKAQIERARVLDRYRDQQKAIEIKAATTIQRHFRGYFTRQKYNRLLRSKNKQVLKTKLSQVNEELNKFYLFLGSEKTKEIVKIQQNIRLWLFRRRLKDKQHINEAALKIQRSIKAFLYRRRFKKGLENLRRKELRRRRRTKKRNKSISVKVVEQATPTVTLSSSIEDTKNLNVPNREKTPERTDAILSESEESFISTDNRWSIEEPKISQEIPLNQPSLISKTLRRKLNLTYLKPTEVFLNKRDTPIPHAQSPIPKVSKNRNFLRPTITHQIYTSQTHRYTSSSPVWKYTLNNNIAPTPPLPKLVKRNKSKFGHKKSKSHIETTRINYEESSSSENSNSSFEYFQPEHKSVRLKDALPDLWTIVNKFGKNELTDAKKSQ
ncbi:unnamed protein product [Blepharisma stoltei]|uniref:Uncharacterized protein n=1 Tax=Blepharisma stoltei TaxID=1481888 RepID=A0AAU9JWQ5_9CILI|nr:unnamed protein product [Blepharisma stoltei]